MFYWEFLFKYFLIEVNYIRCRIVDHNQYMKKGLHKLLQNKVSRLLLLGASIGIWLHELCTILMAF